MISRCLSSQARNLTKRVWKKGRRLPVKLLAGMGKPLGQPVVNPTHQRQLNDSTEGGRPSIVEPNVNAEGFCRAVISLGKSGRKGSSETSSSTYCLELDIAFVELYYWNSIENAFLLRLLKYAPKLFLYCAL